MRRYTVTVNNTSKVIDIEAQGANTFRVKIDGRTVDVELEDHRDLAHSAITPAVTPRRAPTPAAETSGYLGAPGEAPAAAAPAASAPASRPAAAASGGGARDKLTAPMPGVILTVDTAVGKKVARGESLLVLEAMKMKTELKAPKDAVVAEIYVSPGQQVKYGEFLVRFEEN